MLTLQGKQRGGRTKKALHQGLIKIAGNCSEERILAVQSVEPSEAASHGGSLWEEWLWWGRCGGLEALVTSQTLPKKYFLKQLSENGRTEVTG